MLLANDVKWPWVGGCIKLSDYDALYDALRHIMPTMARMLGSHTPLNLRIQHEHRAWEYASAVACAMHLPPGALVLDVGAGLGLFGPVVAHSLRLRVIEVDQDVSYAKYRRPVVEWITANGGHMEIKQLNLLATPPEAHDMVTCLSVAEHVLPDDQEDFWRVLAKNVAPSGWLVCTVDYQVGGAAAINEDDREVLYTADQVRQACAWLEDEGLVVGPIDYADGEALVANYTFFRLAAYRPAQEVAWDENVS